MEPTETNTLDRPIILFRSVPKYRVKLTLDGRRHQHREKNDHQLPRQENPSQGRTPDGFARSHRDQSQQLRISPKLGNYFFLFQKKENMKHPNLAYCMFIPFQGKNMKLG